jgi:hypothetical protein
MKNNVKPGVCYLFVNKGPELASYISFFIFSLAFGRRMDKLYQYMDVCVSIF